MVTSCVSIPTRWRINLKRIFASLKVKAGCSDGGMRYLIPRLDFYLKDLRPGSDSGKGSKAVANLDRQILDRRGRMDAVITRLDKPRISVGQQKLHADARIPSELRDIVSRDHGVAIRAVAETREWIAIVIPASEGYYLGEFHARMVGANTRDAVASDAVGEGNVIDKIAGDGPKLACTTVDLDIGGLLAGVDQPAGGVVFAVIQIEPEVDGTVRGWQYAEAPAECITSLQVIGSRTQGLAVPAHHMPMDSRFFGPGGDRHRREDAADSERPN